VRLATTSAERRWLLWPPLIFFVVVLAVPLIQLIIQSLDGGGSAYPEALASPLFLASLGRTLVMAVIVSLLTVVLGGIYALAIWSAPRWIGLVLLSWLVLSLWTSVMVRTFGWVLLEIPRGALYWFLELLGLTDEPIELYQTVLAMYPAMIAVMLPFAVLPASTTLAGVDREQVSAAVVFGAGPLLVLRSVILPAMVPGLLSGGVLVFVMSLGFYVTPLLLGGPSNLTVSGVIDLQMGSINRPDVGAAMSVMLVAATVVTYLVADRLFRVSERWG
jgi:putative spermidine/putrescine transport system permease protein